MARVDLDGNPIKPITICMIGAGGFIGSHLCEKLMHETPHTVFALDVYNDKIKHLLEPDSLPWAGRITFHRLNIKHDSRLEGLIKMADLVIPQPLLFPFLFCFFFLFCFCSIFLLLAFCSRQLIWLRFAPLRITTRVRSTPFTAISLTGSPWYSSYSGVFAP